MITGLPWRHLRPVMIAFLILATAAVLASSAETSTIIYSTDFSSDPGWVTNNPYTNYWDGEMGMYHYYLPAAGATYVSKKIPYAGESFRREYDLFPLKTDFQSSFRLGLGNREMTINQGTTIFTEFENGPYGNIMWIRVIDQANQRREVSSYGQSYGGPSVRFSDGVPYHVALEYSREQRSATITVGLLSNGSTLWGYSLPSISNLGVMDRIYLSTIGDFENPSAVAEGDLDNVRMSRLPPGTPTSLATTSSPTTVTGGTTSISGTRPYTTLPPPITTPKSSPVPLLPLLAALLGASLLVLARRR